MTFLLFQNHLCCIEANQMRLETYERGDGTGGSQTYIVNSPASGNEVSIPVYGRLFGDQNASAGNYQDHVSVVVSY
jgi:hypothetical protein